MIATAAAAQQVLAIQRFIQAKELVASFFRKS